MRRDFGPYPLWLRCWHWGNVLLFVILLITGFSMHFSSLAPPPVTFRTVVLVHNTAGILLTLFYCFFLFGNLLFGNARYYLITADDIAPGMLRQASYYLWGIFLGYPHPYPHDPHNEERKFNPMQKMSYLTVMFLLFPMLIVTGWALLFPYLLPKEIFGMPGIASWAVVHTYTGYCIFLFMIVHTYLGTTGSTPGQLFGFMWSGVSPEPASTLRTPDLGERAGSPAQVTAQKDHS